jgi:predicted MFS family arabinose efflux permease
MSHSPSSKPVNMSLLGFAGCLAMASAMGFGRFAFTPILPGMMADIPLSASQAGIIAAGNFTGYLAGAILAGLSWATGKERQVALLSLLATSIFLFATAFFSSVEALVILRFASGVASAFSMIFTSQIVLFHAAVAKNEGAPALHYGGVGVGIALSSLLVFLLSNVTIFEWASWRQEWIAGGLFSLAVVIFVSAVLPTLGSGSGAKKPEPQLVWKKPLVLTTLSYGIYGFGYVVTATFLVAMARQSNSGAWIEFLSWFLAGCATVVSLYAWNPIKRRIGLEWAYLWALVALAIGVFASISLPIVAGVLIGGLSLGATFMVVTSFALQLSHKFAPQSPRRAFAFVTAAFGLGQIIGPLAAGTLADVMGSFTLPTVVAACAILISAALMLPVVIKR